MLHNCILCGMLVKGGWVVKRQYILKHYRSALLGIVASSCQARQKLRCPYPDCGPKESSLTLLGLGRHRDTTHDHLRHVMEEDGREGIRGVIRVLYPNNPESAGEVPAKSE